MIRNPPPHWASRYWHKTDFQGRILAMCHRNIFFYLFFSSGLIDMLLHYSDNCLLSSKSILLFALKTPCHSRTVPLHWNKNMLKTYRQRRRWKALLAYGLWAVLAKFWGEFRTIIQLHDLSTKMQTRGHNIFLKTDISPCPRWSQFEAEQAKILSNLIIPITMFHCWFETLVYHPLSSSVFDMKYKNKVTV